jgi:hypothetical protein
MPSHILYIHAHTHTQNTHRECVISFSDIWETRGRRLTSSLDLTTQKLILQAHAARAHQPSATSNRPASAPVVNKAKAVRRPLSAASNGSSAASATSTVERNGYGNGGSINNIAAGSSMLHTHAHDGRSTQTVSGAKYADSKGAYASSTHTGSSVRSLDDKASSIHASNKVSKAGDAVSACVKPTTDKTTMAMRAAARRVVKDTEAQHQHSATSPTHVPHTNKTKMTIGNLTHGGKGAAVAGDHQHHSSAHALHTHTHATGGSNINTHVLHKQHVHHRSEESAHSTGGVLSRAEGTQMLKGGGAKRVLVDHAGDLCVCVCVCVCARARMHVNLCM